MKPRTKEENAAYSKAQREKKRLAAVSPRITSTVSPKPPDSVVPPAHDSCPNCGALAAEIAPLRDMVQMLLAKVAALESDINGSSTTAHQVTPKGDNAETFRQNVITEKANNINTFGRNRSIGSARL